MPISLKIFGAFDRFNYGDLLFPVILKHAFEKILPGKFSYTCYALQKADFQNTGSVASRNYKSLLADCAHDSQNNLIVAGGESLGAQWDNLYSYINPVYHFLRLKRTSGRFLVKYSLAQKILNGKSEHPFCINRDDFPGPLKVLYNSVGGVYLDPKKKELWQKRLASADYLAVREQFTGDILEKNSILHHYVVPDSAVILSDIYPLNSLHSQSRIRSEIKKLSGSRYIFFQIARYKNQNKIPAVIKQLKTLSDRLQCMIVLCPASTAPGHEDHVPLQTIHRRLAACSLMINAPNLFEIMSLIANACLYIGTSLHGIITAMSYGVPYIGLNKEQIKVSSYLETWSCKPLNTMTEIASFADKALLLKNYDRTTITNNIQQQKNEYYASVQRMTAILTG